MIGETLAIPADETVGKNASATNREQSYSPSPEEEKAIKLVERCFQKAKNARKPYDFRWLDYYRMFRGRQWSDQRPSYRHAEVVNLIFRAIQSDVPILTDGRPMPQYVPAEPQDLELAEILNDVLASDWESGNWLFKLTEAIYDAHFYGTGFGCLKFNEKELDGLGKIEFKSEDPFAMYPEPDATDINACDTNYFLEVKPVAVDKLKRKYPEQAQYIKPDLQEMSRSDRTYWNDKVRYQSPTDSRQIMEGQSYDIDVKDQALEMTLYIHDQEYIEKEDKQIDPDTGMEKTEYIQQLKYPKGRKITVVSGVLCEDSEIEYDDRKFPYIRLVNYILPREFWGISEVEQLESPQKTFNKLVSFALDVLTLMGNPVWVVSTDAGIDTDNIVNRPGLIIEKNPGSEVSRQEGVQLQPYVLQLIDRFKGWFDDVSGSTDTSRGIKPEGITAASAIEALQEAQKTRLRQKTRNIDAFMQEFGQMYASRVFQYYDSPRIFRITGKDGAARYFKFHVEHYQDPATGDIQRLAKVQNFSQGADGQYYEDPQKIYQIRAEFDVKVSGGSSLPFEKARLESQTMNLFDRGIIDAEEVLKNLKYPNAEAVLNRMAANAAAAMPPGGDPNAPMPPPAPGPV